MNKIALITSIIFSLSMISIDTFAQTKKEKECSIWLCLPTGFPSGCESAKSAMKKRIKKLKFPLPSLSYCFVGDAKKSGLSTSPKYSVAAFIPKHRRCVKKNYLDQCASYATFEARYIKNRTCTKSGIFGENNSPAYCSRTVRYIDIFIKGKQMGETFYY